MSKTQEKAQEKVRVYALAKELKLDTKDILDLCSELGYPSIKNQLSGLEPEHVDALKKRVKEGPKSGSSPTAPAKTAPAVGPPKTLETKVRTLPPPKVVAKPVEPKIEEPVEVPASVEVPVEPVVEAPAVVAEAAVEAPAAPEVPAPLAGPPPSSVMPASGGLIQGRGVKDLLNPNRMPVLGNRPNPPRPGQPGPPHQVPHRSGPTPVAPPVPAAPPTPAPVLESTPTPVAPAVEAQPTPTPTVVAAPPPVAPQPPRPAALPQAPRPMGPLPQQNVRNLGGNTQAGPPRTQYGPPQPGAPRPGSQFGPPNAGPPRTQFGPPVRPGQAPPPGSGPRPPAPNAGPPSGAKPGTSMKLTLDQIKKLRELEQKRGKQSIGEVQKLIATPDKPADGSPAAPDKPASGLTRPPMPRGPMKPDEGEGGDDKKKPGEVAGRSGRHAGRQSRDRKGPTDKGAIIIQGGQAEVIDQQSGSRRGPRAALMRKHLRQKNQQIVKKEGPVEILMPITVRSLSEAIGMKVGDLSKQLVKETQQLYGVNSVIAFDVAEVIAIGKGIHLVAKKQETAEDKLLEGFRVRAETVDPELLRPRPPVVTIMGHVDHGKTSLLDKIRIEYGLSSDIVSTEAGGITQVLRAWRVEKDGKPVTFLDTPGHEAFTKMRARGANVTDIVVIVVAATDGVMPQTEEAIAHARAADVDIIIAINKIDMPNANIDKTRRQLYQLNILPDTMGGEVPFVETSAVTGAGIGELLDTIGIVSELNEGLMADPTHPASGTCLEAYMDGDRGVMATLLIQQGTLHKGDIILCGSTFGRVRAMYDDLANPIKEAGPSTPVKIFGLNEVPDADDPFYLVDDLKTAAEIADKRHDKRIEEDRIKFAPQSMDMLKERNSKVKVTELKVILKAEARGSLEAIKKELEKLLHEEVRCKVLLAGIGAISESDVSLALTSPEDTLVIGFNVTPDDAAIKLAESRGISLREYQIIYNLVDDVRAALEGRLKPIEEVVHLGRAIVRESFKVSKVGTIAGCYVTQGTIERSARVRVIRDGAVIFPAAERNVGLDSLKRFKDDAKEVREGFECGLKVAGFDDIKVGDVIEAYRIEIRQRTL